jgi:hypothetical protein
MPKVFPALLASAVLAASPAAAQVTYYPDYNYPYGNGYRVFLSGASHSPDRGSCLTTKGIPSATENDLGWATSVSAADGFSDNDDVYPNTYDLTERGYTVQIGYATNQEKINQANAFGAHAFVSVHSNAQGDTPNCSTTQSTAGVWGMYRPNDNNSYSLASALHSYLAPVTPGTNDKACAIPTCSKYTTLQEMEGSQAYSRAYLEQEFHTYEAGARWMYYDISWQHRIAAAIDYHWGSPR